MSGLLDYDTFMKGFKFYPILYANQIMLVPKEGGVRLFTFSLVIIDGN